MNDRNEARRQGIALGDNIYRTQLLLQGLQRNIGTITAAECGESFRFMQTVTYLDGRKLRHKLSTLTRLADIDICVPFNFVAIEYENEVNDYSFAPENVALLEMIVC